jgi:hypothetical protein
MSCRKAYELDLASFLGDPTGATWAEFRDHYPRCAECAAEVRAWTELQLALGRDGHPKPEELVHYVDEPARLSPRARHAIAEHLATCAACRDEAHTLRTFDPLAAPAPAPARAPVVERPSFLRALGRLVWNPVFAYGVALLVGLYPLLSGRVETPRVASSPANTEVAQQKGADVDAKERDRLRAASEDENAPDRLAKEASSRAGDAGGAAAPPEPKQPLQYQVEDAPLARQKHAAPAEGRTEEPQRGAPAASPPAARAAKPDAAPPPAVPGYAVADRAPTETRTRTPGSAAQKNTARADAPDVTITIAPGGDTTATVPANLSDVVLHIDPLPAGADTLRIASTDPQRLLGERPLDGASARVPSAWLPPGRYVVMMYAGDRVAATARLHVTTP